jgi:hypothetical protein
MIISVYAIPGKRFNEPLPDSFKKNSPESMVMLIKSVVLNYYGLTAKQVFSANRKRELVLCRQVMHYLAKKYTQLSLKKIGHEFPNDGDMDHTSVKHSVKTVMDLMDTDPMVRLQVKAMDESLFLEPEERNLVKLYRTASRPMVYQAPKVETQAAVIRMETQSESEKVANKYL